MLKLKIKIIRIIKFILPWGLIYLVKKSRGFISEYRTKQKVKRILKENQTINLELGESQRKMPGWLTMDILSGADIVWDLAKPLPFPDNCVDQIYSSHFLEHLPYKSIIDFLLECKRILKENGALKLAVPNARLYIQAYLEPQENDIRREKFYQPALNYYTDLDYINYIAYMDGEHKYMFDEKQLIAIINKLGFNNVSLRSFESPLDLEERKGNSLYVIARR